MENDFIKWVFVTDEYLGIKIIEMIFEFIFQQINNSKTQQLRYYRSNHFLNKGAFSLLISITKAWLGDFNLMVIL